MTGSSSWPHCPHPTQASASLEQELCQEKAPGRAEHSASATGVLLALHICQHPLPIPGTGRCPGSSPSRSRPQIPTRSQGRTRQPFPGGVSTMLPEAGLQEMLSETHSGAGTAGLCWTTGSCWCSAEWPAQRDGRQRQVSGDGAGALPASPAAGSRGCSASTDKSLAAAPHLQPTSLLCSSPHQPLCPAASSKARPGNGRQNTASPPGWQGIPASPPHSGRIPAEISASRSVAK